MSFESIIMPVLSLLIGIFSFYADPKDTQRTWLKYGMIGGLIFTCGFSVYFGVQKDKENQQNIQIIKQLKDDVSKGNKEVNEQLKTINNILLDRGFTKNTAKSASNEIIQQSDTADRVLQAIQNKNTNNRKDITVEYFPKQVDQEIGLDINVVAEELRSLGFRVNVKNPEIAQVPTNAIWFGSSVGIEDVKLVAYTLIRAGVQIRIIRPFGTLSSSNSNLIQVGADVAYQNTPPLTVDEIRKTSKFTR